LQCSSIFSLTSLEVNPEHRGQCESTPWQQEEKL
jgi:hypothetical protein